MYTNGQHTNEEKENELKQASDKSNLNSGEDQADDQPSSLPLDESSPPEKNDKKINVIQFAKDIIDETFNTPTWVRRIADQIEKRLEELYKEEN